MVTLVSSIGTHLLLNLPFKFLKISVCDLRVEVLLEEQFTLTFLKA